MILLTGRPADSVCVFIYLSNRSRLRHLQKHLTMTDSGSLLFLLHKYKWKADYHGRNCASSFSVFCKHADYNTLDCSARFKCYTVYLIKGWCCRGFCSIVGFTHGGFRGANKSWPTYVVLTEWDDHKLCWKSVVCCMRSGIPSGVNICVAENRRMDVSHGVLTKCFRGSWAPVAPQYG